MPALGRVMRISDCGESLALLRDDLNEKAETYQPERRAERETLRIRSSHAKRQGVPNKYSEEFPGGILGSGNLACKKGVLSKTRGKIPEPSLA